MALILKEAMVVQDISELLYILRMNLAVVYSEWSQSQLTDHQLIEWIIVEEIERVYYLTDRSHHQNTLRGWGEHIYTVLQRFMLAPSLSLYIGNYIKVPRLYGDNDEVKITLVKDDLYIRYYGHIQHPL